MHWRWDTWKHSACAVVACDARALVTSEKADPGGRLHRRFFERPRKSHLSVTPRCTAVDGFYFLAGSVSSGETLINASKGTCMQFYLVADSNTGSKDQGTEVVKCMLVGSHPHAGRLPWCTMDWVFASHMIIPNKQALRASTASRSSVTSLLPALYYGA